MILLDTNVLSELMRPAPAVSLARWVAAKPTASLYTTSISQAEILHGILRLAAGRRRAALEEAAVAMFDEDFAGRVLPFGSEAAPFFAEIVVERRKRGHPISPFDAQIAAIARSTGAALATRNVHDFENCGIQVLDPWS